MPGAVRMTFGPDAVEVSTVPEPVARDRRYLPGLDGLRAVAVIAVILFHLGFGWASGGLLGVGVFFTLSGYLITDLLVSGLNSGALRLRDFWLARARRLLPAVFVVLSVTSLWVWARDPAQLSTVRGQVLAALIYVSNWWQTFGHQSYFARFAPPSPLSHLWSLAVEEQFYVVWPWLLLIGLRFVPERARRRLVRPRLAAVTLVLAAASAVEMALLFHPSFDPSRTYYGTDTRAFGLLFGAALALVWPSRVVIGRAGAHAGDILDLVGLAGLAGIGLLIWRTTEYSPFLYRGGLVLLSTSTTMVILAVVHPSARLGRVLGCRPLRWLGARSYGLYLWHVPVIDLTTPSSTHGIDPVRVTLQVAGSIALAALSWRLIEEPIRHGAIGRLWDGYRRRRVVGRTPRFAVAGTVVAVALTAASLSGAVVSPLRTSTASTSTADPAAMAGVAVEPGAGESPHGGSGGTSAAGGMSGRSPTGAAPTTSGRRLLTSCRRVVHIGDSTSEGMISSNYLPDPRQRLVAQYRRVGVRRTTLEITGGTSIVETLRGGVDARAVARGLVQHGYRGCWVIALGTNDTADVNVGSSISLGQRIEEMMSIIGDQPVLWVDAKTLLSSGPYAESGMAQWNRALGAACPRHPNMHIYDWAEAVQDRWFIPDGIHYYSAGYAARAHLIANALAESFPAAGSTRPSCLVRTPTINLPVLGVR
jgi:peptidoglycan/LPS O-acetylase OafA/YrhL